MAEEVVKAMVAVMAEVVVATAVESSQTGVPRIAHG